MGTRVEFEECLTRDIMEEECSAKSTIVEGIGVKLIGVLQRSVRIKRYQRWCLFGKGSFFAI